MVANVTSVGLGTLKSIGNVGDKSIEVWSSNYDADTLKLLAECGSCSIELELDRRQMQELSVIIDRFLDH